MRKVAIVCLVLAVLVIASGCAGNPRAPVSTHAAVQAPVTQDTNATSAAANPAITVTPGRAAVGAAESLKFSATVTNSTSTALTWSIVDCTSDCGAITADGTYSAPPVVPESRWVGVRATLASDSRYFATASVQLRAIVVTMAPAVPVRLAANGTQLFRATVQFDPANRGVLFSLVGTGCSGDACGTLSDVSSVSAVYHAPATAPPPAAVMLKAASISDANQSSTAAILVDAAAPPPTLQGKYAFLLQGTRQVGDFNEGSDIAMAGHITVDADGSVVGLWDATLTTAGGVMEGLAGNYTVAGDSNGTLALRTASRSWNFGVAMDPGGDSGVLWLEGVTPVPVPNIIVQSGYLLRQDATAFGAPGVAGDRVLSLTFSNVGALGRLTADSAGAVTDAIMDFTWSGPSLHFFTTSPLTGSFSAPNSLTGRGTTSFTASNGPDSANEVFHFAYYIVSADRMLLVELDRNTWQIPLLRGEARRQIGAGTFTNASLSSNAVFSLSADDAGTWFTPMAILGRVEPDGAGAMQESFDENQLDSEEITRITLAATAVGTYSVAANGRVEMLLPGIAKNLYLPDTAIAYLLGGNTGYVIREEVFGTPFGYFEPQSATDYSPAKLAGTYTAALAGPPATFVAGAPAGSVSLGDDGSATAFLSLDRGAGVETFAMTGSYTVAGSGRGVMNLMDASAGQTKTLVFWSISTTRLLAILSVSPNDTRPALIELRR